MDDIFQNKDIGLMILDGIGFICVATTFLVTIINIVNHARNWIYPPVQWRLMFIFTFPLVFGMTAWAVLYLGKKYESTAVINSCHRAIMISAFSELLIKIMGRTRS